MFSFVFTHRIKKKEIKIKGQERSWVWWKSKCIADKGRAKPEAEMSGRVRRDCKSKTSSVLTYPLLTVKK